MDGLRVVGMKVSRCFGLVGFTDNIAFIARIHTINHCQSPRTHRSNVGVQAQTYRFVFKLYLSERRKWTSRYSHQPSSASTWTTSWKIWVQRWVYHSSGFVSTVIYLSLSRPFQLTKTLMYPPSMLHNWLVSKIFYGHSMWLTFTHKIFSGSLSHRSYASPRTARTMPCHVSCTDLLYAAIFIAYLVFT